MKFTLKLLCALLLFSACKTAQKEEPEFPLYLQKTASECGPACLKMISDFFGSDYSFETLALISQMKPYEGTSMGNIADAAELIGLNNLAVKIDYQTLLDEVPYPAMLHWDGHHFVVVYNMDKDSIWIADPAKGYTTYTKKEFLPHWIVKDATSNFEEGYALLMETTEAFFDAKTKIKVHTQSRIEKSKKANETRQSDAHEN